MILKIFISQFLATFPYNLQLILIFFFFFELIDLQGPINFFRSCRYNIGPISETKIGFENIFQIGFFKGKNFALGLKASRVLAMSIFLFSFDSFKFSIILDDFVCVLAGIVQFICW